MATTRPNVTNTNRRHDRERDQRATTGHGVDDAGTDGGEPTGDVRPHGRLRHAAWPPGSMPGKVALRACAGVVPL